MCALVGANRTQADLSDASLGGSVLSDADLEFTKFNRADLRHATLVGAKFFYTDFSNADMMMAKLTRAVGRAIFTDTNLYSTNLGADLGSSSFVAAEVVGVDFVAQDLVTPFLGA